MAYAQKMPYICIRGLRTATYNACLLCSLEDSGIHLLGGCRHLDMVNSYLARHNEASRLILKAFTKGISGKNVFVADLGTQDTMQAISALDTHWPPRRPRLAQETRGCVKAEETGTK